MRRPALALASLLLLTACGGGGDSTQGSSDTTASESAGSTTSTTTDATAGTTAAASDTTASSDTPTTAATTSTGNTSSTGSADEFCGGWQGAAGEPALVLADKDGNQLMAGSTLPLECGGQGLFMFGLYPSFGGFTPATDYLDFTLTADVDGYNTNPDGHFFSADPTSYYVGCEPSDGGVSGVVPILPPDNIADLNLLDGLPAQVHVVLHAPDGDLVADLAVTLSVVKDDSWSFCGG